MLAHCVNCGWLGEVETLHSPCLSCGFGGGTSGDEMPWLFPMPDFNALTFVGEDVPVEEILLSCADCGTVSPLLAWLDNCENCPICDSHNVKDLYPKNS